MPSPSEPLPQPTTARTAPRSKQTKQAVPRLLFVGLLFLLFDLFLFIAIKHFQGTTPKYQLLPAAVYYHRVKKGMTQEAVEHSCGRPEYVEQMSIGDEAEAWFYSASDGQIQIDFDNGSVKKINRE